MQIPIKGAGMLIPDSMLWLIRVSFVAIWAIGAAAILLFGLLAMQWLAMEIARMFIGAAHIRKALRYYRKQQHLAAIAGREFKDVE